MGYKTTPLSEFRKLGGINRASELLPSQGSQIREESHALHNHHRPGVPGAQESNRLPNP